MTRFGTKNKPIVPYFKLQVSGWFDDGRLQLNLKIRVDLLTSRGYRRRGDFIGHKFGVPLIELSTALVMALVSGLWSRDK